MALHIKDPTTDQLVRQLAELRGIGITEAIYQAVSEALAADRQKHAAPLAELRRNLQPLMNEIDAYDAD